MATDGGTLSQFWVYDPSTNGYVQTYTTTTTHTEDKPDLYYVAFKRAEIDYLIRQLDAEIGRVFEDHSNYYDCQNDLLFLVRLRNMLNDEVD